MEPNEINTSVALLLLRVTTGVLFFFQGYDKVFKVGVRQVVDTFQEPFQGSLFPNGLLKPLVWLSSYLEIIAGLMLATGLFRDLSLWLLATDLAMVAIAFSSMKAMWDMQFYFPRLVLVASLLLLPSGSDKWCLDRLI
ncbi:MAG: hypothetical protein RL021_791 [Bacteroidota bacterium]|jgi:uncharacterized membrane protein YphA (DoxX/SURF4 family)